MAFPTRAWQNEALQAAGVAIYSFDVSATITSCYPYISKGYPRKGALGELPINNPAAISPFKLTLTCLQIRS